MPGEDLEDNTDTVVTLGELYMMSGLSDSDDDSLVETDDPVPWPESTMLGVRPMLSICKSISFMIRGKRLPGETGLLKYLSQCSALSSSLRVVIAADRPYVHGYCPEYPAAIALSDDAPHGMPSGARDDMLNAVGTWTTPSVSVLASALSISMCSLQGHSTLTLRGMMTRFPTSRGNREQCSELIAMYCHCLRVLIHLDRQSKSGVVSVNRSPLHSSRGGVEKLRATVRMSDLIAEMASSSNHTVSLVALGKEAENWSDSVSCTATLRCRLNILKTVMPSLRMLDRDSDIPLCLCLPRRDGGSKIWASWLCLSQEVLAMSKSPAIGVLSALLKSWRIHGMLLPPDIIMAFTPEIAVSLNVSTGLPREYCTIMTTNTQGTHEFRVMDILRASMLMSFMVESMQRPTQAVPPSEILQEYQHNAETASAILRLCRGVSFHRERVECPDPAEVLAKRGTTQCSGGDGHVRAPVQSMYDYEF